MPILCIEKTDTAFLMWYPFCFGSGFTHFIDISIILHYDVLNHDIANGVVICLLAGKMNWLSLGDYTRPTNSSVQLYTGADG